MHTWLDLRKSRCPYTHTIKAGFSPSNDSCTHELTMQACSYWVWKFFAVACFWGLSDVHKHLGHLQMAPYPLDKQKDGWNLSHDWLMSLAMDLPVLCNTVCGGENDSNRCCFADFSEDVMYIHAYIYVRHLYASNIVKLHYYRLLYNWSI